MTNHYGVAVLANRSRNRLFFPEWPQPTEGCPFDPAKGCDRNLRERKDTLEHTHNSSKHNASSQTLVYKWVAASGIFEVRRKVRGSEPPKNANVANTRNEGVQLQQAISVYRVWETVPAAKHTNQPHEDPHR